jgi:hypothetical protein
LNNKINKIEHLLNILPQAEKQSFKNKKSKASRTRKAKLQEQEKQSFKKSKASRKAKLF